MATKEQLESFIENFGSAVDDLSQLRLDAYKIGASVDLRNKLAKLHADAVYLLQLVNAVDNFGGQS